MVILMNSKRYMRIAVALALTVPALGAAGLARAADVTDGVDSISVEEIRFELGSVPPDIRGRMNRQQMSQFVENLMADRRLAKAAEKAGIPQRPEVRARIARATRDIVVAAYIDDELARYAASLPDLKGLAQERYAVNAGAYVKPEAIRVSHILFAVKDNVPGKSDAEAKAQAMAVLKQLRAGADFAELARQYSDDRGSKDNGGTISEWAEKGKFVPPFETVAFAMKPGEISDPVLTRFGYHIIRLDDKREARQMTFEEVEDKVEADLRKELLAERRELLVRPFRAPRALVIDNETFLELQKK